MKAKTPAGPPQQSAAPATADLAALRAAYLARVREAGGPIVSVPVTPVPATVAPTPWVDPRPVHLAATGGEVIPVNFMSPWRGSTTVTRISLPAPRIGGKAWLLNRKGIFVLEEGPGVLRTIACTHIGSGSMIVRNGLPNERGEFGPIPAFTAGSEEEYNGRALFRANPVVMGSWMMDAGFSYGLTIQAEGGMDNNCAIATIVWLPAPAPRVSQ